MTMLVDTKSVLASRTVWANLVGLIALLLTAAGVPGDAIGDTGRITDAILQVVAGLGFLASTAFRIVATRRIG
jgi:hypothetical protein